MQSILQLKGIHKIFTTDLGEVNALQDISLEIGNSEFFCIVGPSGCGKTTLLRLIAGLEKSDEGEILFEGRKVTEPSPERTMIFQDGALFPWMNVLENVCYGLKVRGVPRENREGIALNYLRMVHLDKFANSYIYALSGGMKQRVAILRAMVLDPKILLMDEPFTALDTQMKDFLVEEVRALWMRLKNTVIFVTHDIRDAVYLSDCVALMSYRPGRIKKIYRIDLPRPRDPSDPEMEKKVLEIVEELHLEVEKAIAQQER